MCIHYCSYIMINGCILFYIILLLLVRRSSPCTLQVIHPWSNCLTHFKKALTQFQLILRERRPYGSCNHKTTMLLNKEYKSEIFLETTFTLHTVVLLVYEVMVEPIARHWACLRRRMLSLTCNLLVISRCQDMNLSTYDTTIEIAETAELH